MPWTSTHRTGTAQRPRVSLHLAGVVLLAALLAPLLALLVASTGCSRCGGSPRDDAFGKLEPELVFPKDGQQFDSFPRMITLEWRHVPAATHYQVEVEMQNPRTGIWMPAPVDISRTNVNEEKLAIEFPGAQPGRWRVVAFNGNDVKSQVSEWWRFEFSR